MTRRQGEAKEHHSLEGTKEKHKDGCGLRPWVRSWTQSKCWHEVGGHLGDLLDQGLHVRERHSSNKGRLPTSCEHSPQKIRKRESACDWMRMCGLRSREQRSICQRERRKKKTHLIMADKRLPSGWEEPQDWEPPHGLCIGHLMGSQSLPLPDSLIGPT